MTEKEIITGCQKGDPKAEYACFRRYSGLLFTICRRYANDQPQAEDFLQDTFIRIFDKVGQYRFQGSFEGWMRQVCVHVILKKVNKASFRKESLPGELPDFGSVSPTAVEQLKEEALMDLIHALPEGYRVVFNLYAIEGYSHKEIAKMLGIGESTSRSQLTKARKMLQEAIRQTEGALTFK